MPSPLRLVLATNNAHKRDEIEQILKAQITNLKSEILRGMDFPNVVPPEETGATFEENALIKARAYAQATGLPALADDSGLVVDALGGRPGVLSARYDVTTEARNARVLREMEGIETARRTARFECVIALATPTNTSARNGWLAMVNAKAMVAVSKRRIL